MLFGFKFQQRQRQQPKDSIPQLSRVITRQMMLTAAIATGVATTAITASLASISESIKLATIEIPTRVESVEKQALDNNTKLDKVQKEVHEIFVIVKGMEATINSIIRGNG